MKEDKNYEIIRLVNIQSCSARYFWRHIPNTKPITEEQRKLLDKEIEFLNENARYEI